MGDVARPMLAEVLAVLAGTEPSAWTPGHHSVVGVTAGGATWTPRGAGWHSEETPWLHADPAEAQEALSQRGLLPEGWCGDVRRGWYCEACDSYGTQRIATTMYPLGTREIPCERCGGWPRSIPDLVAVASLGWPAIQQAELIAREACVALREYGCPQPERVVWRVGYRMLPGDFAWRPVAALWEMGLALDAISADAVRIVVPPVGTDARPALR